MNAIELLLSLYPNKPWDYENIFFRSDITLNIINIIKERDPFFFDQYNICSNPNISLDIIFESGLDISWRELSSNRYLTIDFVIKHVNTHLWDYTDLSDNIAIPVEIVDILPGKPWAWNFLSQKPMTLDFIIKHKKDIQWDVFCSKGYITLEIIDEFYCKKGLDVHPEFGKKKLLQPYLDWTQLASNKYLTLEIILKYKSHFDLYELNKNLDLDFRVVEEFPDYKWNWEYLSKNTTLTTDIVKKYKNKWNPFILLFNMKVNTSLLKKLYPSHFKRITSRHIIIEKLEDFETLNITNFHMESYSSPYIVEALKLYPNKPWNWNGITQNPYITIDLIEQNQNKIKWENLSMNDLLKINETIKQAIKIQKIWRHYKTFHMKTRHNKIIKLQRWWDRIYYKPGGKKSLELYSL